MTSPSTVAASAKLEPGDVGTRGETTEILKLLVEQLGVLQDKQFGVLRADQDKQSTALAQLACAQAQETAAPSGSDRGPQLNHATVLGTKSLVKPIPTRFTNIKRQPAA